MKPQKPRKLEVIYRRVDSLKADPRNSRKHPPEQLEQLRASIRNYGFNVPVLLKEDGVTIGAGHGRAEAAALEKIEEIPTIVKHGLTAKQWRAYVIADNKIALNAQWNDDILRGELMDLHGLGFNLGEIGFSNLELAKFAIPDFELPAPKMPMLGDVKFEIVISCKTEKEQEKLLGRLMKEGLNCRALLG